MYCMGVLKHVGLALSEYRERHGGKFPSQLSDLNVDRFGPFAFRCPSVKRLGKAAYLYMPPGEAASDDTPVLFCWHHPDLLALTKVGQVRRLKPSEGYQRLHYSSNLAAVEARRRLVRPTP